MGRTALPQSAAALLDFRASSPRAVLLMLPGGACRADRYAWLAALTQDGIDVHILDGALSAGRFADGDGPAPALTELAEAMRLLGARGLPVHAAGHSAGAAAVLDALDPPSNKAARLPPGWALAHVPRSVTIMGCSLQAHALDLVLTHRSEDAPLSKPDDVRLLFLAGTADAMAPPPRVRQTVRRYTPAAAMIEMAGATHYGWAGPSEPGDNPRSDADQPSDTVGQRARTLQYLRAMILGAAFAPIGEDRREG